MSLTNSKPLPGSVGLDADLHVAVVARAAGLTNVLAFGLGGLADGLAIGHLGLAHVGLDLVLAHHAVDDDLQVQLAHAADDGLARVRIGMHLEGRILLRQLGQRHAHLFLVGLGLRLHRHVRSPAPGKSIDSSTIGDLSVQIVSPVIRFFRPTQAQISPA